MEAFDLTENFTTGREPEQIRIPPFMRPHAAFAKKRNLPDSQNYPGCKNNLQNANTHKRTHGKQSLLSSFGINGLLEGFCDPAYLQEKIAPTL